MSSLSGIRRALLWAAGGAETPDLAGIDQDVLVRALRQHRLEGRFLRRLDDEAVDAPETLRRRVAAGHDEVVARVRDQIALFRTVRDSLHHEGRGPGLVPVKGFGLYALTGDPAHAAFSWDIDVLGADPTEVARAVEATGGSGFHFHGEEHPYVFAHMDDVEVHARYIVTGMPSQLAESAVDVLGTPGRCELRTPFSISSVTYDDLVDLLAPGTGEAQEIDVLGPEMSVLIRCAHVYVGFAMNTQPLPWATVRLVELAQMRDYLALGSFDTDVFRTLHERFDAGLVTDFARRLHLDLFGEDPFEPVLGASSAIRDWFPRNLWWDGIDAGFPVSLPWAAADLVASDADHQDLADLLGPDPVVLGSDGTAALSFLATDDDHAGRYVFHRFGGDLGSIRAELSATPEGLHATAHFPALEDQQMAALGWATGTYRYELFYRPLDGTHEFSDYSSDKTGPRPRVELCTARGDGHELAVVFPWESLGVDAPADALDLPLTFRARVQERPWGAVVGGVVAPLRVSRA
ncbi:hypothetical protein CTKZ_25560 [Cellulomonas algicola]|uniref:Uncharacterized protein n=1 Tax=Cellulomonas algicola TaxID=2071633 RepID=A0A401V259_9CELL|nr:nucleotidyltransferase family protein [Cellulomonas algicola]GCD20994.1 hypothetical protein CTKZ_25560 [Cellulomonas algicola]